MTFKQGIDPKTGMRAKRVAVYELLQATPGRVWTGAEMVDVLNARHPGTVFDRHTVNSTLNAFVMSDATIEKYPFIHRTGDGQYVYDVSRPRQELKPRRRPSKRAQKPADVKKGAVQASAPQLPQVTVDSEAIVLVVNGKRMIAYPA